MSLTDKEVSWAKERKFPRRGVNQAKRPWSDSQKIEAVTLWLSLGNLRLTGATLKIPEETLRRWRATQWWKEIAEEIALQDRIQLSATAKNIIDKSLGVLADRLENGDWIYDQKTGQMRRKPVSMKDSLAVASAMMDRKDKLDKTVVATETTESVENKLNKLMEKFSQLAGQPAQVTDVIYVKEQEAPNEGESDYAQNEKREEGLLVRQAVRSESEAGEESDGQEFSEEDDE